MNAKHRAQTEIRILLMSVTLAVGIGARFGWGAGVAALSLAGLANEWVDKAGGER